MDCRLDVSFFKNVNLLKYNDIYIYIYILKNEINIIKILLI